MKPARCDRFCYPGLLCGQRSLGREPEPQRLHPRGPAGPLPSLWRLPAVILGKPRFELYQSRPM